MATILWLLLHLCACSNGADTGLVKHYTEDMFQVPANLANAGQLTRALQKTDSLYRHFPYISVADQYRLHSFKYTAFHSYYSPAYNLDSALTYADSMLYVIELNGKTKQMSREYATAYNDKAHIYLDREKYTDAFRYFSLSRFLAGNLKDSLLLAEYDYPLALILYRQAKYLDAARYYKRALAEINNLALNENKYREVQLWLDDLGLCYLHANMPDSALMYFNKAEAFIQQNKALAVTDPRFPAIALSVVRANRGRVYQLKGDFANAEKAFKSGITLAGNTNPSAVVKLRLTALLIQEKKPADAYTWLNAAQKDIRENDYSTTLLWKKTKWQYDSTFSGAGAANAALIDYLRYKDSVNTKTKDVQVLKADEAFDKLQNEYTLNLLQKNNALQHTYFLAAVMFVVMLCIIGAMVLRNLGRTRQNVTSLKYLNDEIQKRGTHLEALLEELAVSNEEKDRILRIAAHDLRNPAASINMITMLLAKQPGNNAEHTRLIKLVQIASSDMIELLGEILSATDMGNKKMLAKTLVDLNALVLESVQLLRFNALKKQQAITLVLNNETSNVLVDQEKIRRVINNLVSNAIKFSAPGQEICVTVTSEGECYQVAVKDHGIGIAEKDQAKVFDIFTTVRKAGTAGEESFGLGLSICLQIMRAHNGDIGLTSQPGKGSTFFITLQKA